MLKIPYAVRDFYKLITEGFIYFDRNDRIAMMENLGYELLFLRPRRFGKSLWLSTLMNYYDVAKADDFERLFGHLAVVMMGQPGDNHRRYADLVSGEGMFKTLFKNVKMAGLGNGLDRVFMTGVSPIVVNDATSGANVNKDVTWHPYLSDLCDFRQTEVTNLVHQIAEQCNFPTTNLNWLIDRRLNQCLTTLLGQEPLAVQTMYYFKPPGARGQALHQDQYYLRVQPGTCMAAWMAVDDCDEANGCLRVVPGSHKWPVLCLTEADTTQSFTNVTVPLPEETPVVPAIMKAGDVLFFNGQLVHGSLPNTSADRFRQALIGHYIVGEAEKVYQWYHPVLRMDSSEITLDVSEKGGLCGAWKTDTGQPELEMQVEIVNESGL